MCNECNTRLYPCEKTLKACRKDLKDFIESYLDQKFEELCNRIDASIRVEEVVNVNSPDVFEAKYKSGSTEQDRMWNVALRK
jgi:hypothetical protein